MEVEVKTTETHRMEPRPSSFVSLLSGWVQQGMESFFATQRILLDIAVRQNASMMKGIRETLSDPKNSPTALLTEMAVEGTSNFIEAQRVLLDLAQRENEIVMGGVRERVAGSVPATALADMIRRSIDTFVEMQQEFLTIAGKHSQSWIHAAKSGKAIERSPLMDIAREGMENFVNAQKKFLDVVAEETERATGNRPAHMPKAAKKTEITKLAGQAASAFVDSQKKLLDVAAQQMKVNMQLAGRAGEMLTPFRIPIVAMTGESVKGFVKAEKEMIDGLGKEPKPGQRKTVVRRTVKRRIRRRRVASAPAAA